MCMHVCWSTKKPSRTQPTKKQFIPLTVNAFEFSSGNYCLFVYLFIYLFILLLISSFLDLFSYYILLFLLPLISCFSALQPHIYVNITYFYSARLAS